MADQRIVPPPPINEPLSRGNGVLSPVWANWFTQFYARAGASEVTPVTDLEVADAVDSDTLPTLGIRAAEDQRIQNENPNPSPGVGTAIRKADDATALAALIVENAIPIARILSLETSRADDQPTIAADTPNYRRPFDDPAMLDALETPRPRRHADEQFPPNGFVNAIVNGGCLSSHRAQFSLSNTATYGPVDLLAVSATGTVGAGTVKQATGAFTLTQTGAACWVNGVTLSAGSETVIFRHRIESSVAARFVGKSAFFSARTYHDIGSAKNAIITISSADASDNFGAITQIAQQTISIPNDNNFSLQFAIPNMGTAAANGLEIEVKIDCGAVTTKNIYLGEMQLTVGAKLREFEMRPLQIEKWMVWRYLRPIVGLVAVANSGSNMQVVLPHPGMRATPGSFEVTAALDFTDGYTADFSQSGPNIGTIHDSTADNSRADIALFSGLTSGRFHIQRGTSGKILASAEL